MTKESGIIVKGTVIEVCGDKFRVQLENDHTLMAYISGKIRKNKIKVLLGDVVDVEMSLYDFNTGRIIFRYK